MDRRESLKVAREVTEALGLPFVLPAHATIVSYTISDEKVAVTLEIYKVAETKRELRFLKKGLRLMHWSPSEYAVFGWKYQSMTVWDDDFTPYTELLVGKVETPAEYHERRRWEADCYRVGSHRTPLDNAARVTEGYTTEAMTKYWN